MTPCASLNAALMLATRVSCLVGPDSCCRTTWRDSKEQRQEYCFVGNTVYVLQLAAILVEILASYNIKWCLFLLQPSHAAVV
jgi:hypothetical protein